MSGTSQGLVIPWGTLDCFLCCGFGRLKALLPFRRAGPACVPAQLRGELPRWKTVLDLRLGGHGGWRSVSEMGLEPAGWDGSLQSPRIMCGFTMLAGMQGNWSTTALHTHLARPEPEGQTPSIHTGSGLCGRLSKAAGALVRVRWMWLGWAPISLGQWETANLMV